MSFWDSKLVKDLEDGKLPEMSVGIDNSSIIYLSIALLIVGVILILIANLFKSKKA